MTDHELAAEEIGTCMWNCASSLSPNDPRADAGEAYGRAVDDLDRHLRCAVHDEIAFLDPRRCVDQDIDRLSPTVRGPLDDQVRTRTNARDRVRAIGPSNESLSAVLVDPGEAKCRHRLAPFVAHAAADEDLARSGLGGGGP